MIELSVSLASNGVVKVPGYEQLVRFGYTKNRGVHGAGDLRKRRRGGLAPGPGHGAGNADPGAAGGTVPDDLD